MYGPFDKKKLLKEHKEHLCQYNKCRAVENYLHNQLLKNFKNNYPPSPPPPHNELSGYSSIPTLNLIGNLYSYYERILAMELAKNGAHIQEPLDPDKPLNSLYMRLNECVLYSTAERKRITKGNIFQIAYILIMDTGKFQEDCHTWRAKSETNKISMKLPVHFIEAQADLREYQQTTRQRGYTIAGVNNLVEIRDAFVNLVQATAEDQAVVTNLMTENITLTEKVVIYTNRLSTKEEDNEASQTIARKFQSEV